MRLNILLSAHEFSPIQGSECAVGWNLAVRLSKYHNITVLYASGTYLYPNLYSDAVHAYIQNNGTIKGLTLINIDQPVITVRLGNFNKLFDKLGPTGMPPIYYLGYNFWEKECLKKAKELIKEKQFDLAHHLTQIAYREPGYLWKLNIPFVWGPTGGATKLPPKIYKSLPRKFRLMEDFRNISNFYKLNLSSQIRNANKIASKIYSFTEFDSKILQKHATCKVEVLVESGTNPISNHLKTLKSDDRIKGVWCGRITPYKGAEILIRALGKSDIIKNNVELTIIGDGILKESMVLLAKSLGVNHISWINEVKHSEVFALMAGADFFIHTSLREGTPNVIMEALANSLPVICHDAFGMSIAINDSCGIKIPFESPKKSIDEFCDAIESLVLDKVFLNKLKEGAKIRANELSWDNLAKHIAEDYSKLINNINLTNNHKQVN